MPGNPNEDEATPLFREGSVQRALRIVAQLLQSWLTLLEVALGVSMAVATGHLMDLRDPAVHPSPLVLALRVLNTPLPAMLYIGLLCFRHVRAAGWFFVAGLTSCQSLDLLCSAVLPAEELPAALASVPRVMIDDGPLPSVVLMLAGAMLELQAVPSRARAAAVTAFVLLQIVTGAISDTRAPGHGYRSRMFEPLPFLAGLLVARLAARRWGVYAEAKQRELQTELQRLATTNERLQSEMERNRSEMERNRSQIAELESEKQARHGYYQQHVGRLIALGQADRERQAQLEEEILHLREARRRVTAGTPPSLPPPRPCSATGGSGQGPRATKGGLS